MKLFSWALVVAIELSFFCGRVFAANDPVCNDQATYGPPYCLQEGIFGSAFTITPTNINVKIGKPVDYDPRVTGLQIVGALQQQFVTHSCPEIPSTYFVSPVRYRFGDVYLDPAPPAAFWEPGTYTYEAKILATAVAGACPPIICDLGPVTITIVPSADTLIDVDFSDGIPRKKGFAAIGMSTNDNWNTYGATTDIVTNYVFTNLVTAEGFTSRVDLIVFDPLTLATNDSPDAMYHRSLETDYDGVTMLLTNLPAGSWDLYLYSSDGIFDVSVDDTDYGVRTTYDVPLSTPLVWTEGVQYARYPSLVVPSNGVVAISILRGEGGFANIAGLQITTARSNSPPQAPSGMVAWWRADGNAKDSVGTNNGVPVSVTYAWGEVGPAFVLNGSNSYVTIPTGPDITPTGPFTVEAWVNYSQFTGANGGTIVMKGQDAETPGDWALSIYSSGKLRPHVYVGGVWKNIDCDTVLKPGIWYHVAMVYDGTTLRGFVNGARDGLLPVTGALRSSANAMKIGAYSSSSAPSATSFFSGQIDEVTFFSRALSDLEVQTTYEMSSAHPPTLPPPPGLISWWRAESNAWDTAGINPGVVSNGTTFVAGKVGRAFRLDGEDDYVKVPQSPSLNVSNQVTLEFWMRPDSDNQMDQYQGLVGTDFYEIEIANGWSPRMGVLFAISTDGGAAVSPTSFPNTADANGGGTVVSAGDWHHVAGTYDGTNLQLYIDGQLSGNPMPHSGAISPMLANSFLTIGAEDGRTTWPQYIGPRYFKGRIDETSIYNRALSLAEIRGIYNAGPAGKYLDSDYDGVSDANEETDQTDPRNPDSVVQQRLGHWPFDDSTTWIGDGGQLPVVANNLTPVFGWNLNAVRLNNASPARLQYREVEASGRPNINYRRGTIQFWFRPDWQSGVGPGATATLFATGASPSFPGDGWTMTFSPNGSQLTVTSTIHDPSLRTTTLVCNNIGFASNTWHQITVGYSPSNSVVYIDGISKLNVTNILICPQPDVRAQGFFIGSDANGNAQAKGSFDELETFNYVVSSNDVVSGYSTAVMSDANGNGLPDIWEWNHFNSFSETVSNDFDMDGLSNLQEYELGTDPAASDSDYDGRSDAQENNEGTDPLDPNSFTPVRLAFWHFDDTSSWAADAGQLPVTVANVAGAANWTGNALSINSGSPAVLKYRDVETNGAANINCRSGTIRFWFAPDWTCQGAGGSGPGATATFFSLGNDWNLTVIPSGNTMFMRSGGFVLMGPTYLGWIAQKWHQLCMTYSPTGTLMFIDGAFIGGGSGISVFPDATARATNGFNFGSDPNGNFQIKGKLDEVETFNYPLDAITISNDFAAAHLPPPAIVVTDLGESFPLSIALQELDADQIISSVSGTTYPNATEFPAGGDYADSFFASGVYKLDSSSVGVNVTALPTPIITPSTGEFSNVTVVTIAFGSENLATMVDGIYKTELGRAGTTTELNSWTSYASGLRGSGFTDEQVRSNIINSFRGSAEYVSVFHTPGDPYIGNTNRILEYTTDGGNTWLTYSGQVEITQSATLQARARKLPSQDGRTVYAYLMSARAQATYVFDQLALGYWPFDTTSWPGSQGQAPLVNVGLGSSLVAGVQNNAVDLTGADGSKKLAYRYTETTGRANIDIKQGTIRFWFKPNWASTDRGGTGLTGWGRLINFGEWTANASSGSWQIVVNPAGNQIGIRAQDNNGHSIEPLYVPILGGLAANQWRHFAITYSPTRTSIFIDGVFAGSGGGLADIVPPQTVLDQGFFIGTDTAGAQKSSGVFDLLDTFNYELDAARIQQDYATQAVGVGGGGSGSGSPPVITIEYPANGSKIH